MSRATDTWILTAQCRGVLGTVNAVTSYLYEQGCYVYEHQSFDDRLSGNYFIRAEFGQADNFSEAAFCEGLSQRLKPYDMRW